VPNRTVIACCQYRELVVLGQPESQDRQRLEQMSVRTGKPLPNADAIFYYLGENTLLAFLIWLQSWLVRANRRTSALISYLDPGQVFGNAY
jgi:hypothetical protein